MEFLISANNDAFNEVDAKMFIEEPKNSTEKAESVLGKNRTENRRIMRIESVYGFA
jgi:hypothetical protein